MSTNIGTITWASVIPNLSGPTWTNVGGVLQSRSLSIYSGPAFGSDVRWPDGQGLHWNITGIVGHYYMFVDSSQYSVSLEVSSIDDGALNIHWSTWDGTTSHSGNVPGVSPDNLRFRREGLVLIGEYSTDNGSTWLNVFTTASFASDAFLTYGGDGSADPWTTRFGDITYAIDVHNISGISIIPAGTPKATLDNLGVLPSGNAKLDNVGGLLDTSTAPEPVIPVVILPEPNIITPAVPGFAPALYSIAIGKWSVGPEYALSSIANRSFTVRLDGADTFSFTLPGDSDEAKIVVEMEYDVWIYRNGIPLMRNRIFDSNDEVASPYSVNYSTSSYAALLDRRFLRSLQIGSDGKDYSVENWVFPGWKPMDIVKYLILHAESQYGMKLGLTFGQWTDLGIPMYELVLYDDAGVAIGATTDGAYTMADGKPIFTAIQDMQKLAPTFDFWIDQELRCNNALVRGADNGEVLDYGGVIASFSRTFKAADYADVLMATSSDVPEPVWLPPGKTAMGRPVNPTHSIAALRSGNDLVVTKGKTIVTSATAKFTVADVNDNLTIGGVVYRIVTVTSGTQVTLERAYTGATSSAVSWSVGALTISTVQGTGTFSTLPQGGWASTRTFTEAPDPNTLQAAGLAAAASLSVKQYGYSVTFAKGAWRGPSHCWIGDHISFVANRGRIQVNQKMRIVAITINVDQNGVETVNMDLNITRDAEIALAKFKAAVKKALTKKSK